MLSLDRSGVFVMAKGSLFKIVGVRLSEDMVIGRTRLCDSNKNYFTVKEIIILSGIVRDRKKKFRSFCLLEKVTFPSRHVAFNVYRQSEVSALDRFKLHLKDYYPC